MSPNVVFEEDIALRFVSARRNAVKLDDYPGALPENLASAYAIQDAAIAAFGESICGWKVGRINPPTCDNLGTTRLFGPAWESARQTMCGDSVSTGLIFNGGFGAAEAEFMFRIGKAPAAGQTHFTMEDAADLIDAVFIGFEIASSPFAGINAMGPLVTISDFGNNNGLLIGPEIAHWRSSGCAQWHVETRVDGVLVGSGQAETFPGGPIESVRLLLEHLSARGYGAAPGLLISTGAVTGVHEVSAGQRVEARFGDFATIKCSIGHA